jgi:ribosomal protein S26
MEKVYCEYCGKTLPKSKAHYYEDGGYWVCDNCWENEFVTCERCGERIPYDDAYNGIYGYLCECCHDDLFD